MVNANYNVLFKTSHVIIVLFIYIILTILLFFIILTMNFEKHKEEIISVTNNICSKLDETNKGVNVWFDTICESIQTITNYIDDIEIRKNELQNQRENIRSKIFQQNKLIEEKAIESNKTECEYKNLHNELNILSKEYEKHTQTLRMYQKQLELSPHDKTILKLAEERLGIYKELTNIVWDYSVQIDLAATGYARNKRTSQVHVFEYDKTKLTHKEVVDNMWKEIVNSAEDGWSDIINMTSADHKGNK